MTIDDLKVVLRQTQEQLKVESIKQEGRLEMLTDILSYIAQVEASEKIQSNQQTEASNEKETK